jgi:hypothetical protein
MKAGSWDWLLLGTLIWMIGVTGYLPHLSRGIIFGSVP